jgi:hypothetical protein
MKVPEPLSRAFGKDFEKLISEFLVNEKIIPESVSESIPSDSILESQRYLARSILPHLKKLSALFNRDTRRQTASKNVPQTAKVSQTASLEPYWKLSSNPAHLRLAYFLCFMPSNLFRMATVWSELARLGFQWKPSHLKGIEFGAGPASGVCGIAAGEFYSSVGLPKRGSWALIEQDKTMLQWGVQWSQTYFNYLQFNDWQIRSFHRKIDLSDGFLPNRAPQFNLWLMSFYLNELSINPSELASKLVKSLESHLEKEGLVIIIEPALKVQSRRLLEIRKEILREREKRKLSWLKILAPCLGHQICGALENPEDWCHDEATWWRPPYLQKIDKMAGLDHKTLPFSYLVLMRSDRTIEEIFPALANSREQTRYRLVSPAHSEGRDLEFFVCGQDGKRRARFRTQDPLERGDILLDTEIRGDPKASRIDSAKKQV